jgi:hypothetical protein
LKPPPSPNTRIQFTSSIEPAFKHSIGAHRSLQQISNLALLQPSAATAFDFRFAQNAKLDANFKTEKLF